MAELTSPPRPAATIVVCRPRPEGSFEVYLVKRHGRSGFMAGAHVFPGGRVDEADRALGAELPGELLAAAGDALDGLETADAAAYCVAAVRETAEECGLLLATSADGEPTTLSRDVAARVVDAIRAGTTFSDALKRENLLPDVSALRPLAWWITPKAEPKRFDTRFFLAPAPAQQEPRVDQHEATEGTWLTPSEALAAYQRDEIRLAPPTLATLEDLAEAHSIELAAATVRRPVVPIEPNLVTDDSGLVLALPGDPLHDVEQAASPRRTRIVLDESGRFVSRIAR